MVLPLLKHYLGDGTYTLLLLLTPFLVPRAISWLSRAALLWTGRSGAVNPEERQWLEVNRKLRQQHEQQPSSLWRRRARIAVSIGLITYSLLALTIWRPFDIFKSLGAIPVGIQHGKLSSILTMNGLSDRHGHVLPYLTSLDARFLYSQFGEATFAGCQGLCEKDKASDYLLYHTPRLLRFYLLSTILVALSNPRHKTWAALAGSVGCAAEFWVLVSTPVKAVANGYLDKHLASDLHLYRHFGLLAVASIFAWLPRTSHVPTISQETVKLVTAFQTLIQRQDILQTRIKALEVAQRISVGETITAHDKTHRGATSATTQQKAELKEWLRSVVQDGQGTNDMNGHAPVPTLRNGEAQPEREQIAVPPQISPRAVSSDSEVTQHPPRIDTAKAQEWQPPSPAPSSPASTSSTSSRIETPTPMSRVRQNPKRLSKSLEQLAAQGGEEPVRNTPKPVSTVSVDSIGKDGLLLGSTNRVEHEGDSAVPPPSTQAPSVAGEQQQQAATLLEILSAATATVAGPVARKVEDEPEDPPTPTSLPDNSWAEEQPPQHLAREVPASTSSTPYRSRTAFHDASEGWTTVVSRKNRHKIQ